MNKVYAISCDVLLQDDVDQDELLDAAERMAEILDLPHFFVTVGTWRIPEPIGFEEEMERDIWIGEYTLSVIFDMDSPSEFHYPRYFSFPKIYSLAAEYVMGICAFLGVEPSSSVDIRVSEEAIGDEHYARMKENREICLIAFGDDDYYE